MQQFFERLLKALECLGVMLLIVSVLGVIVMFGSFFLNLFGVISYDPPMHDGGNILSVELVDTSSSKEFVVATLTEDQIQPFLNVFLQIRFKRYANDPPEPYGDRMVRILYSDGYVDCIGEEMNQRFGPAGQWVSTKGWYYCPTNEIEILFDKYVD